MPADNPRDQQPTTADAKAGAADPQHLDEAIADPSASSDQPTSSVAANEPSLDPALELAAAKDQLLRLQAEMDNLRKRTSKEVQSERRYGPLSLMRELLPVVDNIDRAIEAAEQTADAQSLLEGFKLVRQQLMAVLDHHHCELIEAEGEVFNPDVHEAILQQPSADHPANSVVMVTQTGYKLHDRVVRPAQVIVSSGPPAE